MAKRQRSDGSNGGVEQGGATLASLAYERLRQDIINAQYVHGGKLPIQALCDRYDVGLSPMREALNRLSRDGLVIQNDRRGFAVAPLSRDHLEELTRTRCWVTELAVRESLARGDTAWEENVVLAHHRLTRIPRRLEGADGADYNPAWEQAHRAFHASLTAACGSRWLIAFCEQLFDAADCYRHLGRISSTRKGLRRDEHQAMVDAIVARDADGAVQLLHKHYRRTAELVRERL
jgi:GntR family carbon starvation induced transcriptional regulator